MTKVLHKLLSDGAETLADKRQVVVNISSEGPDRVGDIIVQAGIDTGPFMKLGGTILWGHDPDQPIAKTIELGVVDGKLRARGQFPPPGVSAKADEVFGLIAAGVINAASIGFSPREWQPIDPKEPWAAQKFEKVELMEFSFVSVPANSDAAIVARSFGKNGFADYREERDYLARRAKADSNWKVGASRNLPVEETESWDGSAAEARIFEKAGFDGDEPDSAWAKKAFLVYDAAAPNLKGSYKLPFADVVDGRMVATSAGVKAAASRLPQADIPAECAEKARAVLDHYEAKMKPEDDKSIPTVISKDTVAAWLKTPRAAAHVERLLRAEKSGRVLSAENMEHLKEMQKCFGAMTNCRTKALDSHGETHDQLEQFAQHIDAGAEHAKAMLKAGKKKPAPNDDDPQDDDSEDPNEDDSDDDDPQDDVELSAEAEYRKRQVELLRRATPL